MNTKLQLIITALGCLLSSCAQRMYFPDRVNSPGFQEGGEVMVNFSGKMQLNNDESDYYKSSAVSPSIDIAVAPVNHLGLIASYRSLNKRNINEDGNIFSDGQIGGVFNGNRIDIGAGFFDKVSPRGLFEIYAGFGRGTIKREGIKYPENNYESRFNRFFIQPAFGVRNKVVTFTTGFRYVMQKYYNFTSANPSLSYEIAREYGGNEHVEKQLFGFCEPFVNFEVGAPYVKFNIQTGGTFQLFGGSVSGVFPMYVSMGMAFRFAPSFVKAKN